MLSKKARGQSAMGFSLREKTATLRAQSAMEFLMTYGWAILIMLVVIAVLFYVGVLNPRNVTPDSLTLPAGFSAHDYRITSSGRLQLDLGNGHGNTVVITGLACSTESNPSMTGMSEQIPSGEHKLVTSSTTIYCAGAEAGAPYRGIIKITYHFIDSDVEKEAIGDISYKIPTSD